MTRFHWLVPVTADHTPPPDLRRPFARYEQIALGADQAGFDAVTVPFDVDGDDAIVVGAAIARITRQLGVDIELHPGAGSPVYLAKLFASLQRATGGRISITLRDRTDRAFAASIGERLTEADHAVRLQEFVDVFAGIWNEHPVTDADLERFDYEGAHFQVVRGGLAGILSGWPAPRLTVPAGTALSTAHVEVASLRADDVDLFAAGTTGARRALSVPVLSRDDAAEAWEDLADLLARAGAPADVDGGRVDRRLWSGFDRLGLRDRVGLVGSHEEVADGLRELADAHDVDEFVLSGAEPLADLYRAGEHLLHRVDAGRSVRPAAAVDLDADIDAEEGAAA
jgi:alkanesulfonate monooxygenase